MLVVTVSPAGDKGKPGGPFIIPSRAAVDIARPVGGNLKVARGGISRGCRRDRLNARGIEKEGYYRIESVPVGVTLEGPQSRLVSILPDSVQIRGFKNPPAVVGIVADRSTAPLGHPLKHLVLHAVDRPAVGNNVRPTHAPERLAELCRVLVVLCIAGALVADAAFPPGGGEVVLLDAADGA